MTLEQIAEDVFGYHSRLTFYGVPMTARTTIVRLGSGALWVHSPGRWTEEVRAAVEALGDVRALIAPNKLHHVFLNDWRAAYPDARCHVPAGLVRKRPDLADSEILGSPGALWSDEIDHLLMNGMPAAEESWFFHRPSRTLIDTDLMHNVHEDPSFVARVGWKLMGGFRKFGPTMLERMLTRDRAALRASIERALEWRFERVVVAHGDVLTANARETVRESWEWLR